MPLDPNGDGTTYGDGEEDGEDGVAGLFVND